MDPKIEVVGIVNYSGHAPRGLFHLESLKRGKYRILDVPIAGDAPKDFLQIYEHGVARRQRLKNWPKYIAKVGHKWYPMESIMEHFLTRLGQRLGFRMANSKLVMARGQLRFCSRYFLRGQESLVHGAELFWGYLNDQQFVEEIEAADEARNFFSFQFVKEAIAYRYPAQREELVRDFVAMLLFDAIVGNHDRHFYNWGIVEHPEGTIQPRFSPIYDTARAFFWNDGEAKLKALHANPEHYRKRIAEYATRSRPKIGWEGCRNLNHFELIEKVRSLGGETERAWLSGLHVERALEEAQGLVFDGEFSNLLSDLRKKFILDSLQARLENLGY
jgi:hypothetical protein